MRMRARSTIMALVAALLAVDGPQVARAQAVAPAPAAPQHLWAGYATAAIANHARRVGAQEAKDKRRTCQGDVNGDNERDVGVLYTLDGAKGADGAIQYLMLLVWSPQGAGATAPKEVGRASTRMAESCGLAPSVVTMT